LAITPEQAATGGENGRPLISDHPVPKANEEKGYNKMLMHLSTSGEYHTYTPDLSRLVEVPAYLEHLSRAQIPRAQGGGSEYSNALNAFIDDIEVGDLFKIGEHLFAKIDSSATWQAEALDPRQFATIVREAIDQRLDASIFDCRDPGGDSRPAGSAR
jgi:hypothetical protein